MAARDILSMLAQVSPALGNALAGNGDATAGFMQGYQRTLATIEENKRRNQEGQQRQQVVDFNQQRTLQQDQQEQQDRERTQLLEGMSVPGKLAQMGAGADNPDQARQIIESVMPTLLKVYGDQANAYAAPALEQATQVITGRQKKQVSDFVEKAMKTEGVANNPDSDPVIQGLPEHISRALGGRPSAKLSELQMFSQLPVGKPAQPEKTRIPAAPGSMEEYSDPKTTPERKAEILKARKEYGQADDRPPAERVGGMSEDEKSSIVDGLLDGTMIPSMLSKRGDYNEILGRARAKSLQTTGKPYNAARAQSEYAAAQRFIASMNGPNMQRFKGLANSVVSTIDEVKALSEELQNSGVPMANRLKLEAYLQTAGNTPSGQLAARYIGAVNTLKEEFAQLAQGGYAPTEAAWGLANQQINGDYGVKQLGASLTEVQRLIRYRMQGFDAITPYGVSPGNPVLDGGGGGAKADPLGIRPKG